MEKQKQAGIVFNIFKRKKKNRKTFEGKLCTILDNAGINVVFDIGANIGQTHERLRRGGYKNRIVSVEPVPGNHEKLLSMAKNDSMWQIAGRSAVGASEGKLILNVSKSSDLSSILKPSETLLDALPKSEIVEKVPTPVTTLDSLIERYTSVEDRIFIKVDTQGYEKEVLRGAEKAMGKIMGFQLELSLTPLYDGEETYLTFLQELHNLGFEPFMITENYFSRNKGRQLQIDVVFMRL